MCYFLPKVHLRYNQFNLVTVAQLVRRPSACQSVGLGFEPGLEPEIFLLSQAVCRLREIFFFAMRVWRKMSSCLVLQLWLIICKCC